MNKERIPTTERLAKALEVAHAPGQMIRLAREGYYDDYKTNIVDNINELVKDCSINGLTEIAKRAKEGEFDGTEWEAEEWAKSPEGRSVFKEFRL